MENSSLKLTNLAKEAILNHFQNRNELLQLNHILPPVIVNDLIELHLKKCVKVLLLFYSKDDYNICHNCFSLNKEEAIDFKRCVKFVSVQWKNKALTYHCMLCKGTLIDQSQILKCEC